MKTRAALFHAPGTPLEVREIDLEEPGPRDVLVRMAATGVCGSDLHLVRGEWTRPKPMVLGHEGAGVIEAVGDGVQDRAPGDRVLLSWAPVLRRMPPLSDRTPGGVRAAAGGCFGRHAP